jgi:hypothetical protein
MLEVAGEWQDGFFWESDTTTIPPEGKFTPGVDVRKAGMYRI